MVVYIAISGIIIEDFDGPFFSTNKLMILLI